MPEDDTPFLLSTQQNTHKEKAMHVHSDGKDLMHQLYGY
jgi:hypothetical protein